MITGRQRLAALLVAGSCLMFGMGLVLPLFTVMPAAGQWTTVARIFAAAEFQSVTYTLPGGISLLWNGNERFLAFVLGLLSVALPIAKLSVLWWETFFTRALPRWLLRFFKAVSHYAMVEVFLVALTVILIKGLPGGSSVVLQAGTWMFTGSVILSLAASRLTPAARCGPSHAE
jgi:Paraquat-inducible protein A